MELQPGGYAVDKKVSRTSFMFRRMRVSTCTSSGSPGRRRQGSPRRIKLLPGKTYVRPSGYKVRMVKPVRGPRLAAGGHRGRGTLCHKPCTVSGGGKSEISKPITDAILTGPVFVADFKNDFDRVAELIEHDYGGRFKDPTRRSTSGRFSARSARWAR